MWPLQKEVEVTFRREREGQLKVIYLKREKVGRV